MKTALLGGRVNILSLLVFERRNHMRYYLADYVSLHIERSNDQLFGTLTNYQTGDVAYINSDGMEILNSIMLSSSNQESKIATANKDSCKRFVQQLLDSGFVSRNKGIGKNKIVNINSNPPLRVLFIETTKKCNMKCRHCYLGDDSQHDTTNELSLEEILLLINQAEKLGAMEIQLTGGEVFTIPAPEIILQELRRRLMLCSIFTNGLYFPVKVRNMIKDNPSGFIFYISIDGPMQYHNWLRRNERSYQRCIALVKDLLKLGCDVRINTSVSAENLEAMPAFIDLIKKEFGILHRLVTVENLGRARSSNKITPISSSDFAGLFENPSEILFLDRHNRDKGIIDLSPPCGIADSMAFVNANGIVSLCPMLDLEEYPDLSAGSIREKTLAEIWNDSDTFSLLRGMRCSQIDTCDYKQMCGGGCRTRAYLRHNNFNAPDKTMCELYYEK